MSATPGRDLAIGAIFAILSGSWDKRAGSTSKAVTRRYILVFLFLVFLFLVFLFLVFLFLVFLFLVFLFLIFLFLIFLFLVSHFLASLLSLPSRQSALASQALANCDKDVP